MTWATQLECEYTKELCEAIAMFATGIVSKRTLPTPAPLRARKIPSKDINLANLRAEAGRQTKRNHKTNVPDRHPKRKRVTESVAATKLVPGPIKEDMKIGDITVLKGSYLRSVAQAKSGEIGCDNWKIQIEVEEAWITTDFIKQSEKVTMPWRSQATIPDRTLKNIVETLELGVEAYNQKWANNIRILLKRAGDFKSKETEARKGSARWTNKVAGTKRTVFMEQLLKERRYPDHDVARCLRKGFPLAGDMPPTGVFPRRKNMKLNKEQTRNG